MIVNRVRPEPGDVVVICHVPEVDLYERRYRQATVDRVQWNGVVLDDGSRVGVESCWPTLRSIVEAVRTDEALHDIDERMMRNAY